MRKYVIVKAVMYNCRNTVIKPKITVPNIEIQSFLFKLLNKDRFTLKCLKNCSIINKHEYTINKNITAYKGYDANSA